MTFSRTVVGLVQIGEMVWERRPPLQFRAVNGQLIPTSAPASDSPPLTYLPHSVALLQAYVQRNARDPERYEFLLPQFLRTGAQQATEQLHRADIVGFSAYVWNFRASLAIAAAVKAVKPQALIVFGGPHVPDEAEEFLRNNPFIDIVCHGEGERTFLDILERDRERSWEDVPSVSFLSPTDRFVRTPRRPRLLNLDELPSPFLDGVYDPLVRSDPGRRWMAVWETNRGCPFSCTFCDWGSATGSKVARYGMARLEQEIEWFVRNDIHHIFVCDANFGILARDVDLARRVAEAYSRRRSHVVFSSLTTKNRTERAAEIQRIFQDSGVVSFGTSLSLQSTDPAVLKAVRRDNISLEAFGNLQRHYAQEGLDSYTDLILGLPGESYQSFAGGVDRVIRGGQLNRVTFYDCSVLPNAPMARPEYRREFDIRTVPVRIIHAHEPIDHSPEAVLEYLDLVVSTRDLNREAWVRTRAYTYMVELVFFDRLFHVVCTLLAQVPGLNYRGMFEAFLDAREEDAPVVAAVRRLFEDHARSIQAGGPQYIPSPEWLNLWWPDDHYALIWMVRGNLLDTFYAEGRELLAAYARRAGASLDPALLDDLVQFNQARFVLPFQWTDVTLTLSHPVNEAYQAVLTGTALDLIPRPSQYRVVRTHKVWLSWDDWCKHLITRVQHRRGFLYDVERLTCDAGLSAAPVAACTTP